MLNIPVLSPLVKIVVDTTTTVVGAGLDVVSTVVGAVGSAIHTIL